MFVSSKAALAFMAMVATAANAETVTLPLSKDNGKLFWRDREDRHPIALLLASQIFCRVHLHSPLGILFQNRNARLND
jgi:hypothetical protein